MSHKIFELIRRINNRLLDFSYNHKLTYVLGKPNGIMVEPYSKCNYNCPLCPSGLGILKRKKTMMTYAEFKKYLGLLKYTTEYITLFHFGEPLLNKELHKMVSYCHKYDISTQISTNGMLLTENNAKQLINAGLNRIIFSIDTYDDKIYTRYRKNGNYDKVINNIKMMVQLKNALNSDITIVAQYMIMKDNEDIDKMKKHGEMLNVDEVLIKTVGIGTSIEDYENAKKFLPKNSKLSRYKKNSTHTKLNNFKCKYVWKRMVLCSDGVCLPCVRDQKVEYKLGQCDEIHNLSRIWNSKEYRRFRKMTIENIHNISMCDRCPEVLKYKLDPWVDNEKKINCEDFRLK